jgi:hypothetical protein
MSHMTGGEREGRVSFDEQAAVRRDAPRGIRTKRAQKPTRFPGRASDVRARLQLYRLFKWARKDPASAGTSKRPA